MKEGDCMKLKKFIKHIDCTTTKVKLYDDSTLKELWAGDILDLQAAVAKDKEYMKDLELDEEWERLRSLIKVAKYLSWHLATDSNREAVGITHYENEHHVIIYVLTIYIRKKK